MHPLYKEIVALLTTVAGAEAKTLPIDAAARDTIAVAQSEPLPFRVSHTERVRMTARIIGVWMFYESRFQARAVGDAGYSCGSLQVWRLSLPKGTCAAAIESRQAGLRWGVRVMLQHLRKCGHIRPALGAYATNGQCANNVAKVRQRCRYIGC